MTDRRTRYGKAKGFVFVIAGLLLFGAVGFVSTQAALNYQDIEADQMFRQAISRFHDGYHSESSQLLQRVLSLQPQNTLARVWLGRALYYAGFENAAIQEWTSIQELGQASPVLTSFLESLEARRGLSRDVREDFAFFPVYELDTEASKPHMFRRPASLVSMPDGSSYLTSFGTNAIAKLDANGRAVITYRGGLTRLSGPFDLVLVQGTRLFSTQMLSDQVFEIDLDGNVVRFFGEKGIGDGQFIGPQFITWDGDQFLYVSDFGNRRISKWDLDGNYILSFGERSSAFAGFERPTGLLWERDTLYIGDASRHMPTLYMFDGNGNEISSFSDERLVDLEDISPFDEDEILLTTKSGLYTFNTSDQLLMNLHESQDPSTRYTSAGLDANGNILASNFDAEQVEVLSRLAGIYSGLHVQINRVVADRFPDVVVDLSILDNLGNPVVGLDDSNIIITEGREEPNAVELVSMGYRETKFDGVILVQADEGSSDLFQKEALRNAVGSIHDALSGAATLALVSAGETPALEAAMGSPRQLMQAALENLPANKFWYLDLGLRMAVPQIVKAGGLRHIFFVGRGDLPEDAFDRYGVEENVHYLINNRIRFNVVLTEDKTLDPALQYIVERTDGIVYRLYDPRGLTTMADDLLPRKDGSYLVRYRSLFDSDFGRKYLPVEVEARLFQKSGRDETGYFAPLQL